MQVACTRAANAPHLGLVLGSGGVRGVAALGIADTLANAGLKPDLIVIAFHEWCREGVSGVE